MPFTAGLLCLLTLLAAFIFSVSPPAQPADLLLVHGHIWTGNTARPWAEAIAVGKNRIIRVGTDAEIAGRAGLGTERIDLGGRFAMPGINDAHTHFLSGSLLLSQVDLTGARSLEEIQRRVKDFAAAHPNAPWITGSGWEYAALPNNRLPNRRDLDAVVADRPVYLRAYDGHTAWVNSKALAVAGVGKDTKFQGFGELVRDGATGEPAGVLKEGAMGLVSKSIPQPSRQEKLEALRQGLRLAASLGITSFQNASGDRTEFGLYEELQKRNELTARVMMALSVGGNTSRDDIDRIAGLKKAFQGSFLRTGAVKIMLDGVIETHTAAMLAPYSDKPGESGSPSLSQEKLNELVSMADRAGLQVYTHAIGDRAVRMALDAYETALAANGKRDSRFRIEHIETVAPSDIPRFARLGVLASMEPIHADPGTNGVWGPAVGQERSRLGFAWRSLEKAGARLVFSSDWPAAISVDPIRGIHNAVNRQTIEGQPPGGWIPEQRISLDSALRAYTSGGAYASFEENEKGTLEEGKFADVVVLSRDLFKIPPAQLHTAHVVLTILDGRVIFRKLQ